MSFLLLNHLWRMADLHNVRLSSEPRSCSLIISNSDLSYIIYNQIYLVHINHWQRHTVKKNIFFFKWNYLLSWSSKRLPYFKIGNPPPSFPAITHLGRQWDSLCPSFHRYPLQFFLQFPGVPSLLLERGFQIFNFLSHGQYISISTTQNLSPNTVLST